MKEKRRGKSPQFKTTLKSHIFSNCSSHNRIYSSHITRSIQELFPTVQISHIESFKALSLEDKLGKLLEELWIEEPHSSGGAEEMFFFFFLIGE